MRCRQFVRNNENSSRNSSLLRWFDPVRSPPGHEACQLLPPALVALLTRLSPANSAGQPLSGPTPDGLHDEVARRAGASRYLRVPFRFHARCASRARIIVTTFW